MNMCNIFSTILEIQIRYKQKLTTEKHSKETGLQPDFTTSLTHSLLSLPPSLHSHHLPKKIIQLSIPLYHYQLSGMPKQLTEAFAPLGSTLKMHRTTNKLSF